MIRPARTTLTHSLALTTAGLSLLGGSLSLGASPHSKNSPRISPALSKAVRPTDAQVTFRANALLAKMTLAEKIGQLNQLGAGFGMGGAQTDARIAAGGAGSVLWVSGAKALNRFQRIAMQRSRLHIPLLYGLDVIHGYNTTFPIPLALASSWDTDLIARVQGVAAKEARADGIHWTFGPMVDIARDPRWGRIMEGAGEDPYLGAAVARAQVLGFQGSYIGSPDHLLACAKHFAGYGAADGGRDYDSSFLSDSQLWNVYLEPFRAAAEAGVGSFMSAYMDLNDVPATGNRFLLKEVLRDTWGFKGFVVSDAFSVQGMLVHGFAKNPADAAYRALTAGLNMDMASQTYAQNLPSLVKQGRVSVKQIEDAVRPILEMKIRLGLFEHPYVDESRIPLIADAPAHRKLARLAAQRSAVLLRNEQSLLPLSKERGSIAVIGPLADSATDMISFWAGQAGTKNIVTIVQGIRNKLGANASVETAPGVQLLRKNPSFFDGLMGRKPTPAWTAEQTEAEYNRAVELAQRSERVVLVLGELAAMSGEAASQSTVELPGDQQKLLEGVLATGKPVVLVLVNGRPLNITWASTHVPAILDVWHPGCEGGNGVADLLFGDATPVGKLPVSWIRHAGQIPLYYAHNLTHQPETDKGFISRYWDDSSFPLYPFGYGLSYTQFSYKNLRVKQNRVKLGQPVTVQVDVTNTGSRSGEEVAQLYIHQQAGSASRPVRQLKGFRRLSLAPGATKTVSFTLGQAELKYWSSAERRWVLEPESFDVWVGGDSNASLHSGFALVP